MLNAVTVTAWVAHMAKKALQPSAAPWAELSPSQIAGLAYDLPPEHLATLLTLHANGGDDLASYWASSLYRRGASKNILYQVSKLVIDCELLYRPVLMADDKFHYVPTGPLEEQLDVSRESAYALVVMKIINADLVPRIRRCQFAECRKYFEGDPRSKWCSQTCGTNFRVRKKRKLEKARRRAIA